MPASARIPLHLAAGPSSAYIRPRAGVADAIGATCPICLGVYAHTSSKIPRLLPCGHSACTKCLWKCSRAGGSACALCGAKLELGAEGPDGLPVNYALCRYSRGLLGYFSDDDSADSPPESATPTGAPGTSPAGLPTPQLGSRSGSLNHLATPRGGSRPTSPAGHSSPAGAPTHLAAPSGGSRPTSPAAANASAGGSRPTSPAAPPEQLNVSLEVSREGSPAGSPVRLDGDVPGDHRVTHEDAPAPAPERRRYEMY